MSLSTPSADSWLREAKQSPSAPKCGMYLIHNGTVRESSRNLVRFGIQENSEVSGMLFSYDPELLEKAVSETYKMSGIYYVRTWLNEGRLSVGDDIMLVLVGGDTRPHVIAALEFLVGRIKDECVNETELR